MPVSGEPGNLGGERPSRRKEMGRRESRNGVVALALPVLAGTMQVSVAEVPPSFHAAELDGRGVEAEDSIAGAGEVPGPPDTNLMLCRREEPIPGEERLHQGKIGATRVGHLE